MIAIEYERILFILAVLAGIIVIIKWELAPYIYDIRLGKDKMEFLLFTYFCIYTLPYSNIVRVQKVRVKRFKYINALDWSNRYFKGKFLVEKKSGFFTKRILITPGDAEQLKQVMVQAGVEVLIDE
jgi:hypothetical protein